MCELYACCVRYFKEKMVIGRDQCYEIFRSNGLVQRKKRVRPKTTNSNHNYYIYPDLLNTTPKFVASTSGSIIVGYSFCPSLTTEGPMKALESAFLFYRENGIDISGLIHHSDRGVQYCSNQYVDTLKAQHISISMTQCGDPLHNALTERVNNTIKNGWLFDCGKETFNQVEERIKQAVYTYNNIRPHQALKMRTPMEIIKEEKV
jgi:putative transposase